MILNVGENEVESPALCVGKRLLSSLLEQDQELILLADCNMYGSEHIYSSMTSTYCDCVRTNNRYLQLPHIMCKPPSQPDRFLFLISLSTQHQIIELHIRYTLKIRKVPLCHDIVSSSS